MKANNAHTTETRLALLEQAINYLKETLARIELDLIKLKHKG